MDNTNTRTLQLLHVVSNALEHLFNITERLWLFCIYNDVATPIKHPLFLQPPFIQYGHSYKYGHNRGRKWVPGHNSDGIRREISREKRWDTSWGP